MDEKEKIRKEVILELIIDKQYDCLKVNSNKQLKFDKYSIDDKQMLYLLKQYDIEKFNAYVNLLQQNNEEED